uniref:RNase H type-1 domain-containing protein n=1 Tax=Oryza sativa subsp. japonica TaxID=39947 RepID=Q6ETD4_ORYSJ|nr:hypothetical protein [Oryza sativa Japonica Group]
MQSCCDLEGKKSTKNNVFRLNILQRNPYCQSALETELLACRDGIALALQWTLLPIVVESDCQEAIQLIKSVNKACNLILRKKYTERTSCNPALRPMLLIVLHGPIYWIKSVTSPKLQEYSPRCITAM